MLFWEAWNGERSCEVPGAIPLSCRPVRADRRRSLRPSRDRQIGAQATASKEHRASESVALCCCLGREAKRQIGAQPTRREQACPRRERQIGAQPTRREQAYPPRDRQIGAQPTRHGQAYPPGDRQIGAQNPGFPERIPSSSVCASTRRPLRTISVTVCRIAPAFEPPVAPWGPYSARVGQEED